MANISNIATLDRIKTNCGEWLFPWASITQTREGKRSYDIKNITKLDTARPNVGTGKAGNIQAGTVAKKQLCERLSTIEEDFHPRITITVRHP